MGKAMMAVNVRLARLLTAGLLFGAVFALAGCDDQYSEGSGRSLTPIPAKTLALMDQMGATASSPVIFRAYKKEAEFEIWKQKSDGQYALLKTYPMCRWSGQLGPKKREGDRQVPEGFYTIAPSQMNPNSHYYLSMNVGYPNAYDRAWDREGGDIMVHGICSSRGCFSMTDPQIAEIYAIAREAFNAGQREIQFQSYPFRMTSENLAKFRYDPNIAFWKELKNGSDHFDVTKAEVPVTVCNRHYVFGAKAEGEVSAREACPKLIRDPGVESAVAEKASKDDAEVADLAAKGVKPIMLVYDDGGQNPEFAGKVETSRPDSLAAGPREIVIGANGKPLPTAVEVAAADAKPKPAKKGAKTPASAPVAPPADALTVASTPAPAPSVLDNGKAMLNNLFKTAAADSSPTIKVVESDTTPPADAPKPPRHPGAAGKVAAVAAPVKDDRKAAQ
jgi:murein L,D-transpeptidase YafK